MSLIFFNPCNFEVLLILTWKILTLHSSKAVLSCSVLHSEADRKRGVVESDLLFFCSWKTDRNVH